MGARLAIAAAAVLAALPAPARAAQLFVSPERPFAPD